MFTQRTQMLTQRTIMFFSINKQVSHRYLLIYVTGITSKCSGMIIQQWQKSTLWKKNIFIVNNGATVDLLIRAMVMKWVHAHFPAWWSWVQYRIEVQLTNWPGLPGRPSIKLVPEKDPGKVKVAGVILITSIIECQLVYYKFSTNKRQPY